MNRIIYSFNNKNNLDVFLKQTKERVYKNSIDRDIFF